MGHIMQQSDIFMKSFIIEYVHLFVELNLTKKNIGTCCVLIGDADNHCQPQFATISTHFENCSDKSRENKKKNDTAHTDWNFMHIQWSGKLNRCAKMIVFIFVVLDKSHTHKTSSHRGALAHMTRYFRGTIYYPFRRMVMVLSESNPGKKVINCIQKCVPEPASAYNERCN